MRTWLGAVLVVLSSMAWAQSGPPQEVEYTYPQPQILGVHRFASPHSPGVLVVRTTVSGTLRSTTDSTHHLSGRWGASSTINVGDHTYTVDSYSSTTPGGVVITNLVQDLQSGEITLTVERDGADGGIHAQSWKSVR